MPSMIRNRFMILCMGTCHIRYSHTGACKQIFIHTQKLLRIRCVLHPKFPGVEQRFDSWWTGGSVDAKSIFRSNQPAEDEEKGKATWVFPKIGVFPPKWMVKIMENPIF